ncbi:hypothetical protein BU23DRAFT_661932 [Bimuria novae-zelandiae CBS 107.79]|uniref:SGNH hydrolase-type esterase domain-containing protein n=1 Tax=Bimuria novae-zelandiae CBS 107.79 TaxID=1447943 RepID=A0A6A5UN53_9PLEO|nr:hypothetical protein BU23DRAFT_661932 [Bimuria novae-zelandiae CBS 107.79]
MNPPASFLDLSEQAFLERVKVRSSYKERSLKTLITVHWPELTRRLDLPSHILPDSPTSSRESNEQEERDDPFALPPNLSNKSRMDIVYLGNSMLERLKTTGKSTKLAQCGRDSTAWNVGCGGDKNENVMYRLFGDVKALHHALKPFSDIKLWVVISGTNNLRKKPFHLADTESYQLLLESCLWIAPKSKVIACDMFYRKDIPDAVVDESN